MIPLSDAQSLFEKATQLAKEHNRSISVCIVDTLGHEVAGIRMDGASWFTLGVARGKAQTSALFSRPSQELQNLWITYPDLVPQIEQQLAFKPTTLEGGMPIYGVDNILIGAIGIAGALPEIDQLIAETLASPNI